MRYTAPSVMVQCVANYFAYLFQVWPPKTGSYLLIVLLMMGIFMSETC
jgi:hypothetical protein